MRPGWSESTKAAGLLFEKVPVFHSTLPGKGAGIKKIRADQPGRTQRIAAWEIRKLFLEKRLGVASFPAS